MDMEDLYRLLRTGHMQAQGTSSILSTCPSQSSTKASAYST